MHHDDLRVLEALTDLAFQRDMAGLQPVLAREAALRRSLARLKDQEAAARADPERLALMRPLGADVTWQAWVSRTRRDLNTRLAAVLAEKETHLAKARRAFGRARVAAELRFQAAIVSRKSRETAQQRALLEQVSRAGTKPRQ
jgi:hypothetical protein